MLPDERRRRVARALLSAILAGVARGACVPSSLPAAEVGAAQEHAWHVRQCATLPDVWLGTPPSGRRHVGRQERGELAPFRPGVGLGRGSALQAEEEDLDPGEGHF